MVKDNLNLFKALAVIAVILIHTTGTYLAAYAPKNSLDWNFYLAFDALLRPSVPLFVFLSGFGLARRYAKQKLHFKEFFSRRVVRIIPSYLFWSAIIYVSIKFFEPPAAQNANPLWKVFLFGRADIHLYFVPMIFQLYLLFPLLLPLVKKLGKLAVVVALVWQILEYSYIGLRTEVPYPAVPTDQQQYLRFFTWIFYFLLGIYLAINFPSLKAAIVKRKNLIFALLLFALSWTIVDSFRLNALGADQIVATRFTRLPVLLLATSVSFITAIPLPLGKITALLSRLGPPSYQIYLLHTLVLRLVLGKLLLWQQLPMPLVSLFIVAISAVAGVTICETKQKNSLNLKWVSKVKFPVP